MIFDEALKVIEKGIKVKIIDWGYPEHAYIQLDNFYGEPCFVMIGHNELDSKSRCIYRLTYTDIKSNKWICVDHIHSYSSHSSSRIED